MNFEGRFSTQLNHQKPIFRLYKYSSNLFRLEKWVGSNPNHKKPQSLIVAHQWRTNDHHRFTANSHTCFNRYIRQCKIENNQDPNGLDKSKNIYALIHNNNRSPKFSKTLEKTYKDGQRTGQESKNRNGIEIGVQNRVGSGNRMIASHMRTFSLYKALKTEVD